MPQPTPGPASTRQPRSVQLLPVRWPAPPRAKTFCSTRIGGNSQAPFSGLNLSSAGGDAAQHVAQNMQELQRAAGYACAPRWPRQVHGTHAAEAMTLTESTEADAVYTRTPQIVCAVRTADCLPVLLCDRAATTVAAAHAGWRGLAAGVLEATVTAMACPPAQIIAWLGPAIGPSVYEVGPEVRDAFMARDAQASAAFAPSPFGGRERAVATQRHWLADLYLLARQRLASLGVGEVHGGGLCTYSDPHHFFSYRRDGVTGRMACGIWLADD